LSGKQSAVSSQQSAVKTALLHEQSLSDKAFSRLRRRNSGFYQFSIAETLEFTGFIHATKPVKTQNSKLKTL
jgi:hypothetical protein